MYASDCHRKSLPMAVLAAIKITSPSPLQSHPSSHCCSQWLMQKSPRAQVSLHQADNPATCYIFMFLVKCKPSCRSHRLPQSCWASQVSSSWSLTLPRGKSEAFSLKVRYLRNPWAKKMRLPWNLLVTLELFTSNCVPQHRDCKWDFFSFSGHY